MGLRSIFLFAPAECSEPARGPTAYAISLAKAHGASLTIFCIALDVTTPGRQTDADSVAQALAGAANAAGVKATLLTRHSHAIGVLDVIAEHARLHDLAVLGVTVDGLLSERTVTEHLMIESGRALILVPHDHASGHASGMIAVAWDNTAAAARALGDAISLFDPRPVHLLTIDGEKQLRGDLEPAGLIAAVARRSLDARHKAAALGERTIAAALQDEAQALGAPLLAMGAFGHSRLRHFVLGSATADLLESLRMPVLVSH